MATFNRLTRTLAPIRNTIKRGYYSSPKAMEAWAWSAKTAKNASAYGKNTSKRLVSDANVMGRDAMFTASRTIGASSFSRNSLIKSSIAGAGIGAGIGAAGAYADGGDIGRGAMRGGMYGAGAGLAFGGGKSLYGGYRSQAASRMRGYGSAIGPQLAAASGPMLGPKNIGTWGKMKRGAYGTGLFGGIGIS